MTKCFGHYLLSLNNIYILYILSLWHSLPSAAAIGVSPPKSGYGEERRHEYFCEWVILVIITTSRFP